MEAVNLEDSLAKRISLKDSSSETMATSACVNCVKLFGKTTYTIFFWDNWDNVYSKLLSEVIGDTHDFNNIQPLFKFLLDGYWIKSFSMSNQDKVCNLLGWWYLDGIFPNWNFALTGRFPWNCQQISFVFVAIYWPRSHLWLPFSYHDSLMKW